MIYVSVCHILFGDMFSYVSNSKSNMYYIEIYAHKLHIRMHKGAAAPARSRARHAYICIYMYIHLKYIHTYMYIHTKYMHIYMHKHIKYIYIRVHIYTKYICVYVYMYVYICTYMCIYVNICIYI